MNKGGCRIDESIWGAAMFKNISLEKSGCPCCASDQLEINWQEDYEGKMSLICCDSGSVQQRL